MNKPESNCFLLVIRTESRPVLAASSVVSTRSIADVADAKVKFCSTEPC